MIQQLVSAITFDKAVLFILGLSTFIFILEKTGFLPDSVVKYLVRKRLKEIIEVLNELGIRTEMHRRANLACEFGGSTMHSATDTVKRVASDLKTVTIATNVTVGKTEVVNAATFIDLMGATTNRVTAVLFAKHLTTHWKNLLRSNQPVGSCHFDFVATPKSGSPLLGYEFANLTEKPFALHLEEDKFGCAGKMIQKTFDISFKPTVGMVALVVDDSCTGGRKVVNTIKALRDHGFIVKDCLVVFASEDVILHSLYKI